MSTLKISSIENVAGTKYMDGTDFVRGTARAFVYYSFVFNPGINRECNVAAVTEVAVGTYGVTFKTPFKTSTYGMAGSSGTIVATGTQASQPYIEFEQSRTLKSSTYCQFKTLVEATGVAGTPYEFQVFFIGD